MKVIDKRCKLSAIIYREINCVLGNSIRIVEKEYRNINLLDIVIKPILVSLCLV